ncbi:MAG: DUF4149 domain-containing protein [bacterium]
MRSVLRFCLNTSLGIWLGATVFFLLVLITLFGQIPAEAGRVASLLFPTYYITGVFCALFALASAVLLAVFARQAGWARKLTPVVLVLAMAGVNYYGGWVVLPEARAARIEIHLSKTSPAKAAKARERFQRLHRLSIQLFGVVFFLLAVTLLFTTFTLRS